LMRGLAFVKGRTVKRLAAEWGLSEQRVRELSAEASKRVRAELTDPDRVTVTVCGYLERTLRDARKDRDHRAVVAAAKAWAELAGLVVQRHEVTAAAVSLVAADPAQAADLYEAMARALRSGSEGE
jgi:nucleoid DNA-binding protein